MTLGDGIRQRQRTPRSPDDRPQEMPAVRTTIVGGRPPGCGKSIGEIPRGIEVLVKKAAVDSAFRAALLTRRAAAADEIGLRLESAEAIILENIPAAHLQAIINRTKVHPSRRAAFLGRVAGVMLAALGASAGSSLTAGNAAAPASAPAATAPAGVTERVAGVRVRPAPAPPARPPQLRVVRGVRLQPAPVRPDQIMIVDGIRIDRPPPTAPVPTTQSTTQPADPPLKPGEFEKLLKQLDDDEFKVRDAAHKRLRRQGARILPEVREALKDPKISLEVRTRLESLDSELTATTQPVRPEPRPRMIISAGVMVVPR